MKPEINNENKRRFFGLYTEALIHADEGGLTSLLLKPLSSISDEDLAGVEFTFPNGKPEDLEMDFYPELHDIHWIARSGGNITRGVFRLDHWDFLRSRGYALPWMGITVEEQTEAGWVKLIES